MKIKCYISLIITVCLLLVAPSIFAEGGTTKDAEKALHIEVENALKLLMAEDSTFGDKLNETYAYVVFPSITKAGFILGGSGGSGEVYKKEKRIGRAKLAAGSIGAQIGGQVFIEVILFEDKNAFEMFTLNKMKLSAQVTAVAISEGAAMNAKFEDGVAVIILAKGGLMAEASVGGQKLTYIPEEN